jgi:hypothetical protein
MHTIAKRKDKPNQKLILRALTVRSESADVQNRSVKVAIATETPVERYDEESEEVIDEILTMDGLVFRNDRRQLPIVDSHDRSTVRNVLGSVRNIRVENNELVGDAFFAHDQESQAAYQKLLDGHLTDFSVTALPMETQRVRRGDVVRFRDGSIAGPTDLVTKWMPTDASLVATGADANSTVRRSYQVPKKESKKMMTEEIKNKLVGRGMPAEITEIEQAIEWMLGQDEAPEVEIESEESPVVEELKSEATGEEIKQEEMPVEEVKNAVARALETDKKRRKEIVALCKKASLTRAFADSLCERDITLAQARSEVLSKMITRQGQPQSGGERITVTSNGQDRFASAIGDALIMRAQRATGSKVFDPFAGRKPSAGHEDFVSMGLKRMAEEILRRGGISTNRMTDKDIAMVALGHESTIRRLRIERTGEAYYSTGMLPNLMLDAANKSLLAGYEESPVTWDMWARKAPSVPDFKNVNRIRFSESQDLEMVPENHDYPESKPQDDKESYHVDKFGRVFSVTWETVVNDDLDAISRIPQMHGSAARRTVNKRVYQVLTANAAMSDGVALFNSAHGNQSGSSAAPNATTLNAAYLAMMTQTGKTGVVINVQPQFLIVPAALSATASVLLTSTSDPAVGGSAVGNANVNNLYGPNGDRRLKLIVEPQLDLASTANWYVAASSGQVDTVEVAFLDGEESPILENEWDFDKDVYKYKIRQTFGVKAIDWRGLYRNS